MRTSRLASVCAMAGAMLTAVPAAGAAQTVTTKQGKWTITMTVLPGGSSARSISEQGDIVGTADASPYLRPIWRNGVLIDNLDGTAGTPYSWDSQRHAVGEYVVNTKIACTVYWTPDASGPLGGSECTSGAYDINESGESAGSARFTAPTIHRRVVTWTSGVIFRDLGLPPGAREAVGTGINDHGDVAGYLTDAATGRIEAFVHRDGEFTRLPSLAGPYASYAWDINYNGDIVGTSNGGTPVVWRAGSAAPTVLPIPAGRYPHSVWRINDSGDVVGTVSAVYPAFYSAALWRKGEFIDLGVLPTGTESYAYDISNAGVIVGTSTTGTPYGWHAVTWTVTASGGGRKRR